MEGLETAGCLLDNILDFSSDIGEEEDDDETKAALALPPLPCSSSLSSLGLRVDAHSHPPYPEVEEELEWLSNKDVFPGLDSFVDMIHVQVPSGNSLKQQSPVSVLEGSNAGTLMSCCADLKVPGKARSKTLRRRRDARPDEPWLWHIQEKKKSLKLERAAPPKTVGGRKCTHCGAEKTPQWRAGPTGPKSLCNACGVRYKSGRLVPEYRPASSPTFSSKLHSNSHRKIMEMRKMKHMETG